MVEVDVEQANKEFMERSEVSNVDHFYAPWLNFEDSYLYQILKCERKKYYTGSESKSQAFNKIYKINNF
jgi:hypothetical protein